MKIYAILEGSKIIRMSYIRGELVNLLASFPPEEKRRMWLGERDVKDTVFKPVRKEEAMNAQGCGDDSGSDSTTSNDN